MDLDLHRRVLPAPSERFGGEISYAGMEKSQKMEWRAYGHHAEYGRPAPQRGFEKHHQQHIIHHDAFPAEA